MARAAQQLRQPHIPMPKTKVLCVLTSLLGNSAMTKTLVHALDRLPGLDPTYVIVEAEDYAKYPAPWWARLSNPWQAQFMARRKAELVRQQAFDALFVHGWENAIAFEDLAKRMPAAVMMDAVPATMDRQLRLRGLGGWKRWISHEVHHRAFRSAAVHFDYFLPWTSDCAASLQGDYGVAQERCFVTLLPQNLDWWAPPVKSFAPPWKMLFVGNDFERKGGEFLLRLYTGHLADACSLTIVSNDPSIAGRQLPAGVRWIQGATREQVRDAYWNSDLFLFPTRQDFGPLVIAEAAAAGLPALATDVGGIPDLIRSGETGFALPRDASLEQWAARIHGLLADPEALRSMSGRARTFAEETLNLKRFDQLIANVMDRLRVST
jgi:glycosyltransferase involved in cell wall biosynthesis